MRDYEKCAKCPKFDHDYECSTDIYICLSCDIETMTEEDWRKFEITVE